MNTDVDEKVRKFYKLKEQYENERRATATSNKSKQFKCISCRRLVGSTFKHIANADGTRNLFAVCGDTITPCKLNINIHLGATVNNEDEMIMYKKKISELKKNIILGKNDLLFGYVSRENALENFNKLKEDLTRDTDIYEKELQLYTNTVNNLDKITKTIETQNKITDTVTDFQNLIRQYAKTSEQSFINDSIDMYINTLLPELHAYKELTIPLSAKDFEMNYDDPRVISDEFGPIISSKNTTIKRKVKSKKTPIKIELMPSTSLDKIYNPFTNRHIKNTPSNQKKIEQLSLKKTAGKGGKNKKTRNKKSQKQKYKKSRSNKTRSKKTRKLKHKN